MVEFEKGEELLLNNPYYKSTPRRWTKSEEEYILKLRDEGKSIKEISKYVDRTVDSVKMKLKRLNRKNGSYNQEHYSEKNIINHEFVEYLKPKTILDLYSGRGNPAYEDYNVVSNDIEKEYDCDYHLDALKCITKLYSEGKKFDLIDLDPFGSAYDCLDLAIKMAKKGLCITLGELGHRRFNRFDYVGYRYGITNLKEFNSQNMIKKIQEIGKINKKDLEVYTYRDWQNISRVWFIIKPYKILSQWDNMEFDWSDYYDS